MARVLITGGAGFIGSHVARSFLAAGYGVYLYDSYVIYSVPHPDSEPINFSSRLKDIYSSVTVIRGSTLNKDFLRRQIGEIEPDVIVHMAAMPLAAIAIEHTEEAFQSILNSTQNILEIMRDLPPRPRLVYVSSSMVYGDFTTDEIDEDHPTRPKDIYGAFKLAGEIIVTAYAKNHGLDCVIARPSAVYGPTDMNNRVVQKFVRSALRGEPLVIEGDGSARLDFTFVEDCALGVYLCGTRPEASGKTYNVTRGEARSLRDLVTIIQERIPNVAIAHRPPPAYMPRRGTLSIARARQDLGFEPKISLEEGVGRYIDHLRHNPY